MHMNIHLMSSEMLEATIKAIKHHLESGDDKVRKRILEYLHNERRKRRRGMMG
jgi:hypothetical protein